jgi:hypothetical protein
LNFDTRSKCFNEFRLPNMDAQTGLGASEPTPVVRKFRVELVTMAAFQVKNSKSQKWSV